MSIPILRVRDQNGNYVNIPAIRGPGDMEKSAYDSDGAVVAAGGIAAYVQQNGGGGGGANMDAVEEYVSEVVGDIDSILDAVNGEITSAIDNSLDEINGEVV